MNGYEKAAKGRDEETLFPGLDPSNGVKLEVWRKYHQNRFWSHYFETPGNSCPCCASLDYEVNERELYAIGQEEPAHVNIWYSCNECARDWVNDAIQEVENDEERSG